MSDSEPQLTPEEEEEVRRLLEADSTEELIRRGVEAGDVLANDAIRRAFKKAELDLWGQWIRSRPEQSDLRESLHAEYRGLVRALKNLRSAAGGGKLLEKHFRQQEEQGPQQRRS